MPTKPAGEEWLTKRYRLRPGYFFSFPKPNQMQIRMNNWGESIIWIRDREEEHWVLDFFGGLDGRLTVEQLLDRVPAERHADVYKIVGALRSRFFREVADSSSDHWMEKRWQQIWGARKTAMDVYRSALQEAQVLIIGAGVLGSRFATGIAQWNPSQITIVDKQEIQRDDIEMNPAFAYAEVGESRAEVLAKTLNRMAGNTVAQGMMVPQYDHKFLRERIVDSTHVFVVEDGYAPDVYDQVNRIAVEEKVRWTLLLVDGWDLYVGPTFFPDQSGCYHCLEQAKRGEMKQAASYVAYRESLQGGQAKAPSLCSPMHADLAAGFLASDAIHLLGIMPQRIEEEASLTIGRQLRVNLRTFDALFYPMIKMPRCEVCGTAQKGEKTDEQASSNPSE